MENDFFFTKSSLSELHSTRPGGCLLIRWPSSVKGVAFKPGQGFKKVEMGPKGDLRDFGLRNLGETKENNPFQPYPVLNW